MSKPREHRDLFGESEMRVEEVDGKPMIIGHAAVFDDPVELWPGFKEVVRRGAFKKTIGESDVRALFNHNPDYLLGHQQAQTLKLSEDDRGLAYTIGPVTTDLLRDLVIEPIRKGELTGSSFSFDTIRSERTITEDVELRELLEVRLWDVGPVTFPAYPSTDAQVRAAIEACNSLDELAFLSSLREGGLTDEEIHTMVRRMDEILQGKEPEPRSTPTPLLDLASRRIRAASLEV